MYVADYTGHQVLRIDPRDLRRVLEGNQDPNWPHPPGWAELTQSIAV